MEVVENLYLVLALVVGLLLGAVAAAFAYKPRLTAQTKDVEDAKVREEALRTQLMDVQKSASNAEGRLARLVETERELAELRTAKESSERELQQTIAVLSAEKASLESGAKEREEVLQKQIDRLEQIRTDMVDQFKLATDELNKAATERLVQSAEEALKNRVKLSDQDLEARQEKIKNLLQPIETKLKEYDDQVKKIDTTIAERDSATKERLELLSKEIVNQQEATRKFREIFSNSAERGRLGELHLETLLTNAGLVKGQQFTVQESETVESGRKRPDCTILLPSGQYLVVDAKTTWADFERAADCHDPKERADCIKKHATQVKNVVTALAGRQYDQTTRAPEMVVVYFPVETMLHAALEGDQNLVDDALSKGVLLASPTVLTMVLRYVVLDWRQHTVYENAQEIRKLGNEMLDRLRVVVGHYNEVGAGLEKAVKSYNKATVSIQSNLLTTAQKLEKNGLQAKGGRTAPVKLLDVNVQEASRPTLLLPPSQTFEEDEVFEAEALEPESVAPEESEPVKLPD